MHPRRVIAPPTRCDTRATRPWAADHAVPATPRRARSRARSQDRFAASAAKSSTAAGAISRRAGSCDTSAPSRPVIQWIGASRCVPVCSPVVMLFQYQAGPASLYRLISLQPEPPRSDPAARAAAGSVSAPTAARSDRSPRRRPRQSRQPDRRARSCREATQVAAANQ